MRQSAVYRSAFEIGVLLFAASTGLGLAYEVATQGRLPEVVPDPFEQAAQLLSRGAVDEFVSEYRTRVAIAPHAAKSRVQLGFALERAGDSDGALREFRTAARLDPDSGTAHYNVAVLSLRRGDVETARRHARRAQRLAREAGERLDPRLLEALGLVDTGG